jgi:hypothetical protein
MTGLIMLMTGIWNFKTPEHMSSRHIRPPAYLNLSVDRECSTDGSYRDVERGCFPGWAIF